MRINSGVFISAILALFLISASAEAWAQETDQKPPGMDETLAPAIIEGSDLPKDLLALDYLSCYNGCANGYSDEICKPLCLCAVRQLQKRFVKQSYLRFRLQLSLNNLDEGNRIIATSMAEACTAEIEQRGIEIKPKSPREPSGT